MNFANFEPTRFVLDALFAPAKEARQELLAAANQIISS